MAKSLEEKVEIFQHLQRWQNLLMTHSLELAELINNLDEEAAADIRKVLLTSCCHQMETGVMYKTKLGFFDS